MDDEKKVKKLNIVKKNVKTEEEWQNYKTKSIGING